MNSVEADIRVQEADFDLAAEYAALRARATGPGAVAAFVGLVRDVADDADVSVLELEHYPGLTEATLRAVVEEACGRWPLTTVTVVHRVGRLAALEQIVLVLTASAHRDAAYDGNRFLMDHLKTRAVFWKKEHGSAGARWIEAKTSDHEAVEAWRD